MKLKKEGEWKREKGGGGNRNWYNKDLALRPAYSKCLICDFKIVDLRSVTRCMGMKEKIIHISKCLEVSSSFPP